MLDNNTQLQENIQSQNITTNNTEKSSPVKIKFQDVHPDVDIEETKDEYIVNVDIPGMNTEDMNVCLDKDILTVEARSEIEGLPPRHYYRQFRVMRGLDAASCKADYKLGVLTLRLPKPQLTQPKQIKIACE